MLVMNHRYSVVSTLAHVLTNKKNSHVLTNKKNSHVEPNKKNSHVETNKKTSSGGRYKASRRK